MCLRCGQSGHLARNCHAGSDRKRKAEDDADINMVETFDMTIGDDDINMVETFNVTGKESEDYMSASDIAVQDGGAASFLASFHQIRRYLRFLLEKGYDMTDIEVYRCKKGFRYGNSEREVSNLCVMLPTFVGHRRRHILCYLVKGQCPILVGRPMLEKLGLTVDYCDRKIRWKGQKWREADIGKKGEYLLHLCEDFHELQSKEADVYLPEDADGHVDFSENVGMSSIVQEDQESPAFSGAADWDPVVGEVSEESSSENERAATLQETVTVEHQTTEDEGEDDLQEGKKVPPAANARDEADDLHVIEEPNHEEKRILDTEFVYKIAETKVTKKLTAPMLRKMVNQAEAAVQKKNKELRKADRIEAGVFAPRRKVWEVFVGEGRVSEYLWNKGEVDVEIYSYQTGWDFERAADRKKFLKRLREDEPDRRGDAVTAV